jgi:hypothetical protein
LALASPAIETTVDRLLRFKLDALVITDDLFFKLDAETPDSIEFYEDS